VKDQQLDGRSYISLGLQGGGSFGAFTWGILDRLLEQGGPNFDMISGASAGAVNAVVLADGLAAGGRVEARARLARLWERVGHVIPGGGTMTAAAVEWARLASPYQLNPLGFNPLRDLLAEVDFQRLRVQSPVRLLISATRVRDGHPRLFREHEITLEAVLASACLPFLHHAVVVDGEAYWDGGYSANPPLRQLVVDTNAGDILLVQLVPEMHEVVPQLSHEIAKRVREIGFNASLLREQEAVAEPRVRGAAAVSLRVMPQAGRPAVSSHRRARGDRGLGAGEPTGHVMVVLAAAASRWAGGGGAMAGGVELNPAQRATMTGFLGSFRSPTEIPRRATKRFNRSVKALSGR